MYRCSRCGAVLYVFERVGQDSYGVPTPSEVVDMYDGVCPWCGHRLNAKPSIDDVLVLPKSFYERIVVRRVNPRITPVKMMNTFTTDSSRGERLVADHA